MSDTLPRAVFLDRDGVLIENVVIEGVAKSASRPEEVVLLDGVVEACQALKAAGLALIMVTNQPDAKRGRTPREFVEATNADLASKLGLTSVEVCWHDNEDGCPCRKPRPGLILQAAQRLSIDLKHSVIVGDRWRDIDAGHAAGCETVLIEHGYSQPAAETPDFRAPSLLAAVPWILEITGRAQ